MIQQVSVKNLSTKVSDAEVSTCVQAIAKQLANDYARLWQRVPPVLAFYPNGQTPPTSSNDAVVYVLDSLAGVDELLGEHTESATGVPTGYVMVDMIRSYGGTVSTGRMSISCTLSHEILELIADPNVNLWAADPNGGYDVCYELCDPVEADWYTIDGVAVSNFVTPDYFDPLSTSTVFDALGKLNAPLSIGKNGYQIRRMKDGTYHNVFGSTPTPQAVERKSLPTSRSMRRQTP